MGKIVKKIWEGQQSSNWKDRREDMGMIVEQ